MFKDFSNTRIELIYLGLKSLIETKSGHGFHNADGGHPVYLIGSKGKISKEQDPADSPDKSALFKMLSSLSIKLKDNDIEASHYNWWQDLSTWQQYCQFIVTSYQDKINNSDENSLE